MSTPHKPSSKPSPKPSRRLRLVGYSRVSTDDQKASGLGLEAQAAALSRWALAEGHELVAVVSDPGVSGSRAPHKRPGFQQALELLEAGKADGILSTETSRLCRDTRAWLALRAEFQRQRWEVALVSSGVLPQRAAATAEGTFMETVLAAAAQHYRDYIARKTREGLEAVREQNRSGSRVVRFGFRTESSVAGELVKGSPDEAPKREQLVPEPAEYAQLQQLLELRRQGLGARRIAAALGVNARTGKPWRYRTVESVLATEARWAG